MRTEEDNGKIIMAAIKDAMLDFREHPFDWTVCEIEGQFRFYNILRTYIKDKITIDRDSAGHPIPSYKGLEIDCLRLEYGLKVGDTRKEIKPDICVFDNNSKNTPTKVEELDMFIEIKIGWGYRLSQFNGKGILKDLDFIGSYPSKGYLVYFIGNEYKKMKKGHIESYRRAMESNKQTLSFNAHQVFIVFRDVVVNGDFEEISLQN